MSFCCLVKIGETYTILVFYIFLVYAKFEHVMFTLIRLISPEQAYELGRRDGSIRAIRRSIPEILIVQKLLFMVF